MSGPVEKNCLSCRAAFVVPNMQGRVVCRRFPPASVLVGSMQIAGSSSQPIFDTIFPSVSALIYCEEYKPKPEAMATDGNVTSMAP